MSAAATLCALLLVGGVCAAEAGSEDVRHRDAGFAEESAAPADEVGPGQSSPGEGDIPEVRAGIDIVLHLTGGERISGILAYVEEEHVVVSTLQEQHRVPLLLVEQVEVGGELFSLASFVEGLRRWSTSLALEDLRAPAPVLAGGASLVWAGAGPLVLGDVKEFLAYSFVEGVFVGTGVVLVVQENYAQLITLGVIDLFLRSWAAQDSFREARRRRRRLQVGVALLPPLAPASGGDAWPLLTIRIGADGLRDRGSTSTGAGAVSTGSEPTLTGYYGLP